MTALASAVAVSEPTAPGDQLLVSGIRPISHGDRLALRAAAPLRAIKPQRPLDIGLFDLGARNQLDLFGAGLGPSSRQDGGAPVAPSLTQPLATGEKE